MAPRLRRASLRLITPCALLALMVVPLSAQQAADTAAVSQAKAASTAWLGLVDRGLYEASWDSAAPAFQAAVTKSDWVQAVVQARGMFEPFGARTLIEAQYVASLPNAAPGPYVVIQYSTKVKGDRTVIETVAPMRTANGAWRVSGYFVRPEE